MKDHFRFIRLPALVLALMLCVPPLAAAETADAPGLAAGADARVMSYNLMHPDWSHVPMKGRDEIVAAILRCYMPDVVALQEAGAKWHKALTPLLVDTGLYAPACRQSHADGFVFNTTAFLYNPRTVSLVEEYIVDLEVKNATRVFSVAVFEREGVRFVVTNTHPAPREEPEKYARHMADLTAAAAGVMEKYDSLPVIMAGDFNTPEQAAMYQTFMDEAGVRDAKYEAAALVRGCSTWFGYQAVPDPDETDCCIDHLFVNDRVDVRLFDVVIGHDALNASDHVPIYADIGLK